VLDVGCGRLVISGRVQVKHGVEIDEMKEESVVFTDGSEIPADVIIFAYVFLLPPFYFLSNFLLQDGVSVGIRELGGGLWPGDDSACRPCLGP
jgi:hypothetical protein